MGTHTESEGERQRNKDKLPALGQRAKERHAAEQLRAGQSVSI